MPTTKMMAPKGTTVANIQGHVYTPNAKGVIKVVTDGHIEDLTRHGFTEHFEEDTVDLGEQIDAWDADDKEEAVKFIEERGGEADTDMGLKKLKRLAREAAGVQE